MDIKAPGRFLNQPYPYYYHQRQLHKLGALVIALCFIINFFFEPFVVYVPEHKISFVWISLVHSVLPVLIAYGYFTLANFFFDGEETWVIGKEILNLAIVLLLIGISNFLIRDLIYDNPRNWSWQYLYEEIRNAFLVGSLLVAIIVPLNFNNMFRKYHQQADDLNRNYHAVPPTGESDDLIFIKTQVKGDDFQLKVSGFLFARVAGNYVELIMRSEGVLTKQLKRISIKDLGQQLAGNCHIMKTHRAYLINTQTISDIKGNAQGYQLTLDHYPEKVPVSRSMIPRFNAAIVGKS